MRKHLLRVMRLLLPSPPAPQNICGYHMWTRKREKPSRTCAGQQKNEVLKPVSRAKAPEILHKERGVDERLFENVVAGEQKFGHGNTRPLC